MTVSSIGRTLSLALSALVHPLLAQIDGVPAINNPSWGIGITLSAHAGSPGAPNRLGSALVGRLALGFESVHLAVLAGTRRSRIATDRAASSYGVFGATAAYRIAGSGTSVGAVSLQSGFGFEQRHDERSRVAFRTSVGVGMRVPTGTLSLEPWAAAGVQLTGVRRGRGLDEESTADPTGGSQLVFSSGIDVNLSRTFGLSAAVDFTGADRGLAEADGLLEAVAGFALRQELDRSHRPLVFAVGVHLLFGPHPMGF